MVSHKRLCIGRLNPAFGSSHSASSAYQKWPTSHSHPPSNLHSFAPIRGSDDRFARQNRFGLPTGFPLSRHSSPSFGSQRVCSGSASRPETVAGHRCAPHVKVGDPDIKVLCARGLLGDPVTRAHIRLLGSCFKTGRAPTYCAATPSTPKEKKLKAARARRATGYAQRACARLPKNPPAPPRNQIGGDESEATVRSGPRWMRSEHPHSESTYKYPPSRPTKKNERDGASSGRGRVHPGRTTSWGRGRCPHVRGAPSLASAEEDDTGAERLRHWTSRAHPFPSEQFHVLLNSLQSSFQLSLTVLVCYRSHLAFGGVYHPS
ncbi:hypothetical protein NPIL_225901 [Nephila pilipes]|uniref:Uncharacterized protein n=1 Tax=Nephila pilipes TaxID=299642 RepID=A0A8X6UP21_NEPPI|nr:hypothetical protein NPIL_225901 [Nephila pilipes]